MRHETRSSACASADDVSLAAAALINAVGSLMDQIVESSSLPQQDVAVRMGVTPGRVSQIVGGDGNVRVATLARLAEAAGFAVSLTATARDGGRKITVPRAAGRIPARFGPH